MCSLGLADLKNHGLMTRKKKRRKRTTNKRIKIKITNRGKKKGKLESSEKEEKHGMHVNRTIRP